MSFSIQPMGVGNLISNKQKKEADAGELADKLRGVGDELQRIAYNLERQVPQTKTSFKTEA